MHAFPFTFNLVQNGMDKAGTIRRVPDPDFGSGPVHEIMHSWKGKRRPGDRERRDPCFRATQPVVKEWDYGYLPQRK